MSSASARYSAVFSFALTGALIMAAGPVSAQTSRPAPTFSKAGSRLKAGVSGQLKLVGADLVEAGTVTSDSPEVKVNSSSALSDTELGVNVTIGTTPGRYTLTYTNRFGSANYIVEIV